ncbi:response regulator [Solidesulfovibrio sp.]|uniref:response regulator n=1 Tax=Solidesulfovibrio sp. TaxID=2910990 RepID=UPI002637F23E|nr:response regulator [Solidesulfovibrio sp.]
MRVLVVDDDPASRHVLSAHLSGLAETVLCESGLEAVENATRAIEAGTPFDVVFLDIIMPHMDGHETLVRLREVEDRAGVPPEQRMRAVMVTSMDDETNTMTALFDGQVAAYLIKPPNRSELLEKLVTLGLLSLE